MRKTVFLSLPLLLVLCGCQSFSSQSSAFREPGVSLNSVDIVGINLSGVTLAANVGVENFNGFPIPMPKIDWEFSIDEASFVQGILEESKTIGSREKFSMDIPIDISYDALYKTFNSLIESFASGSSELPYKIAMGLTFPIPALENNTFQLDFSGMLPLPQLPKLSLGQMRVTRLDLSGIDLACGINVENPNKFVIPFPEINWDYGVNGVSLVKSKFSNPGDINPGVTEVANIVVSVAYADILRVVGSVLNMGTAQSNLSLDAGLPIAALDGIKNTLDIPGTLPWR